MSLTRSALGVLAALLLLQAVFLVGHDNCLEARVCGLLVGVGAAVGFRAATQPGLWVAGVCAVFNLTLAAAVVGVGAVSLRNDPLFADVVSIFGAVPLCVGLLGGWLWLGEHRVARGHPLCRRPRRLTASRVGNSPITPPVIRPAVPSGG